MLRICGPGTQCRAKGCLRPVQAKRLCMMHYQRQRRYGTVRLQRTPDRKCRRCGTKHYAKGLCRKHYNHAYWRDHERR